MEKRYQVFVSSTFEDLVEERQEVMQALLELDCMPAGMELFPAADDDQWTLIKRVIDDCDYYIVIIGGRYGSLAPSGKSYTQMEYEYAVELGKPVIAFLHKDPGKLPAEKTEKESEKAKKLEEFRDVAKKKMVKYWISASDLGSVVSRSLVKLIKTHPAIGWVKADVLPDKSIVEENLQLRKTVDDLTKQLDESRTTAPEGTENLAQGNDVVELHFSFGGYKSNDWTADVSYKHSFKVSWNDIFAHISPAMINEASEATLQRELDNFVRDINLESLSSHTALKSYRLKDFSLNADDFNTIKVQLLALNLIKKSDKSRSVKDKATYWTLTPYGESTMMKLRAVKRPGTESDVPKPAPSNKAIEVDTP